MEQTKVQSCCQCICSLACGFVFLGLTCLAGLSICTIGDGVFEYVQSEEVFVHVEDATQETLCEPQPTTLSHDSWVHLTCDTQQRYDFAQEFSQNVVYSAISKFYEPSELVGACLDFNTHRYQSYRRQLWDPPSFDSMQWVPWQDTTTHQLLPTWPSSCPGDVVPRILKGLILAPDNAVTIGAPEKPPYGLESELLKDLPTNFVSAKDAGNISLSIDGLPGVWHVWSKIGWVYLTSELGKVKCGDFCIRLTSCEVSDRLSAIAAARLPGLLASENVPATLGLPGSEADVGWLSNGDRSVSDFLLLKRAEAFDSLKMELKWGLVYMMPPVFLFAMMLWCTPLGPFLLSRCGGTTQSVTEGYDLSPDVNISPDVNNAPICCMVLTITGITVASLPAAVLACAVVAALAWLLARFTVATLLMVAVALLTCICCYVGHGLKEPDDSSDEGEYDDAEQ